MENTYITEYMHTYIPRKVGTYIWGSNMKTINGINFITQEFCGKKTKKKKGVN